MEDMTLNAFQSAVLSLVEDKQKNVDRILYYERVLGSLIARASHHSLTVDAGRGAGHTTLAELFAKKYEGRIVVIDAYSIRTGAALSASLRSFGGVWHTKHLEMVVVDGGHLMDEERRDWVRSNLEADIYLFLG